MKQSLWNLNFTKTFCIFAIYGHNTLEKCTEIGKVEEERCLNLMLPQKQGSRILLKKSQQYQTTQFKQQNFPMWVECRGTENSSQLQAK